MILNALSKHTKEKAQLTSKADISDTDTSVALLWQKILDSKMAGVETKAKGEFFRAECKEQLYD